MLGLPFTSVAVHPITPPLLRANDLGLLDEPIFTIYFKNVGEQEDVYGGTITYGGLDLDHCENLITYEPLTSAQSWQFRLRNVYAKSFSSSKGWEALSDTSNAFNGCPPAILEKIAKQYDGK
ncbi:unnamed protein product, partial [Strongylus vulgaris]